jgi:hypothetical protein
MAIIGTLPVSLQNGTLADATQVMADFNFIVSAVNANAPALVGNNAFNGNQNVTGTVSASGAISGAAFIPTSSTVPANGMYLVGANDVGIASNTTLRWDVNGTGNHTFASASSGTTITLGGGSDMLVLNSSGATVSSNVVFQQGGAIHGMIGADGTQRIVAGSADGDVVIRAGLASAGVLRFVTEASGASTQMMIGTGGNVTIAAPSSGQHTINGVANNGTVFTGATLSGIGVQGGGSSIFWVTASIAGNEMQIGGNGSTAPSSGKLNVTFDGRLYGTALHNNAGSLTGTTNQYIASGTYQPAPTAITNIASVAAASNVSGKWLRVGNTVHFGFAFDVDPTAGGLAQFRFSLPPCGGTLAAGESLSGTACAIGNATSPMFGQVSANVANNQAQLDFVAGTDLVSRRWSGECTYEVI